jgi:hypothetical protein
MARYLRYAGLASIVVVDSDEEIDALLDHPDLDRTYAFEGPALNRLMISRLRHAIFRDGRPLLSFAPREESDRAAAQGALAKRLDALAERQPWADEAIAAMAAYVTKGADRNAALAALTYATAYPFLAPDDVPDPLPFEPAKFCRLFALYEVLQRARNPWKGLPIRLLGQDRRAAQEILRATGGDDYGLHAVGVTLANSVLILERLRALFADQPDKKEAAPDTWNKIRVAPAAVTRQNKVPCKIPGIPGEVPANSLFLMQMRQAMRPASPAGFEFATKHWSFCPASRYIEAIFASVYDAAKASRMTVHSSHP